MCHIKIFLWQILEGDFPIINRIQSRHYSTCEVAGSMLLEDYSRYVIECELEMARIPKDAPSMPLSKCLPHLIRLIDDDEAVYEYKNGSAVVRILTYDITTPNVVTLLFQLIDQDASDPAFGKLATGKSRTVAKEEDEGMAATAHLTVSLQPINESFPDTYAAVFEEVPGITKTLIGSCMTSFFHDALDLEFERIRGDKSSTVKCRPSVSLMPLSEQNLSDCFNDGWLLGFSVVRKVKGAVLDEDGDLRVEESRLLIKTKKSRSTRAMELVKKAVAYAKKEEYTGLRIMYEDGDKRKKTLPLNPKRQDLFASTFVKTEYVPLSDKIALCQEDMHDDLNKKMKRILAKR